MVALTVLIMAGQDWMNNFLLRHPDLSLRKSEATSGARAMGFNKLNANRIYNCDETGITVNPKGQSKVLATEGKRQVGIITSAERGETVTAVICFSASGRATKEDPVLLLFDGHSSHTKNLPVINAARENGVILLCFPPHCSHKLQPCDVSFMKPLSIYYEDELRKWLRCNLGKVVNGNISSLFGAAFIHAANIKTAMKGFVATGLWLLNNNVFSDEDFLPSIVLTLYQVLSQLNKMLE
ncbi:uncharacterized protein LOC100571291 [Acyrthosiphon pisum]|uniref:DDE-1 domain-containing protein n=1 Tax=Acyrthosiphon pisum TaxID=7029 RepID=A0A8R2B449_ACYPI|nr:uncharacterized protein LOC100571291 [Acyrthosiphon pisum]|eukprot:XP_008180862.1 PREDICTED: uncharacterized protein LOC100571291 [Acyrthosiphon pisum]